MDERFLSNTAVMIEPKEAPRDYYRWAKEQAALIRAGRFAEVDIENVAEEIDDVAKSEMRAFRSNIESILVHVLKWQYQPTRRCRSWELSIIEHRHRVDETILDSASIAAQWDEVVGRAYRLARLRAARETGMPLLNLPEECPYDRKEILEGVYSLEEY